MVLNQVIIQIDVLIVEEMEEFVQIKVFLLFNKHALNVPDREKKLQIHVPVVEGKERNKHQKDYQLQFQKVWMMELE